MSNNFKINGVIANTANIVRAIYANQNAENPTDAEDNEILYYENGAPASSPTLSFSPSTNQLDIIGTIVALTGSFSTLSATSQFNLPNSMIQPYDPTPAVTINFTASGINEGYTLNLGGIKLSWGQTRWERTTGGAPAQPLFTVQNLGGVFSSNPFLISSLSSVAGNISQYIVQNAIATNAFNFYYNNSTTTVGEGFVVAWFAIGN